MGRGALKRGVGGWDPLKNYAKLVLETFFPFFFQLPFFAKITGVFMKIWVDFGPKSNIFTFPIFWSGKLVLRLKT